MQLPYTVYILRCANNQYYTGFSANFAKRLKAHRKGEVFSTKRKLPVTVVCIFQFNNKQRAYDFERYLKSGSGIAFRNKRFV